MFQLPFLGCQAANDLAQRPGTAEMAKHQRDELAPARHAFGVLLRLMLVHRRIENCSREKFENLLENAGYLFHGWVSPSVELLVTDQLYQERPPGSPTLSDRYTRLEWLMNVLDSSAFFEGERWKTMWKFSKNNRRTR